MSEKIVIRSNETRERLVEPVEFSIDLSEASTEHFPRAILEWMSRLPEKISFTEPVTLVIGENGSGKTQFCRALAVKLGEDRIGATMPDNGNKLYLDPNEPANVLKDAIKLSSPRKGNIHVGDLSGAEIAQAAEQWRMNQAELHTDYEWKSNSIVESDRQEAREAREHLDDPSNEVGSAREVFDMTLKNAISLRLPSKEEWTGEGDVVVIYDEPEYGMSPRRQLGLPDAIASQFDKKYMVLVPTNNLVLFDSDLPRLDLSMPERGVHRPSEYGEGGLIKTPIPSK